MLLSRAMLNLSIPRSLSPIQRGCLMGRDITVQQHGTDLRHQSGFHNLFLGFTITREFNL